MVVGMQDVVAAPPRGLELFASGARRKPLDAPPREKRALAKLGIETVQDLLQHYPRGHFDRREVSTIAEITKLARDGFKGDVSVHARVDRMNRPFKTRTGKLMIQARVQDETGQIGVTWFNQKWLTQALKPGTYAFFHGRVGLYRGRPQLSSPRVEKATAREITAGKIIPVYGATAEITSEQIRKIVWSVLKDIEAVLDPVPPPLASKLRFVSRDHAVRSFHEPGRMEDIDEARDRLVFDEVFTLQLGLVYRKRKLERTVQGISHPAPGADSLAETFVAQLPFSLTDAQRRACDEVATDLTKTYPMHRLLEGEVGSGKTVVALYGCLVAIEGGRQAAFMAPTEVLAEQHHLTVNELLDRAFGEDEARNLFASVSRRPVVRLLTGSTPAANRQEVLREVAMGEVDLLIGTHALIQESVEFARLGVAVVDEQHRFGVHQRKALREKGAEGEPDILVMTATPIPRTLAVTIYGDLDVSILDELPAGRRAIETRLALGDAHRPNVYDLVRREVSAGRQAFVVYALREESDKVELRSAKAEAKRLAEEVFPDLAVGLVHGDMKSQEKEEAMTAFRDGKTQVLVATTVVEVGVDVPNATVMVIEDADRFGLAQLHQLRGRIGRGEHQSYCALVTDLDLERVEEDPAIALAAERLQAVVRTQDGFELAIVDLRQRREGQLVGARQSGMSELKITRVLEHQDVIKKARDLAVEILEDDPELRAYEHAALAREMRDRFPEGALDVVQSG
jgi:ATP-dependent DNA helicase RecG